MRRDAGAEHRAGILARGQRQVATRHQGVQRTRRHRAAGLQHHQRIGQRQHLLQRVADIDHRQPERLQPHQVGQDLGLALGVQAGQRLVHQQQAGVRQQRPPDRHPLALPARERVRPAAEQLAMPSRATMSSKAIRRRPAGAAPARRSAGWFDRQVREQPGVLEHQPEAAALRRQPESRRGVGQHRRRPPRPGPGQAAAARRSPPPGWSCRRRTARTGRCTPGRRLEGEIQLDARESGAAARRGHRPTRARSAGPPNPTAAARQGQDEETSDSRAATASPPAICSAA